MPDTDTQSRVTTFIPPIVVQSRYEPYSRSIRNFSYATSTHHDRYAAFEAALAKAGIAKWTLYEILEASDEATIKRIFLEYFDGEPSKLFSDKTEQELNSTVPKEVIDAYLPHIDELHNAQQHDERLFAKQLTDNFIAQLRRQHIPLPGDLESRLETRVEGVLPDIIRQSATLGEVEGKVKNYLVGTLAFIPETQPIAQGQQTTLEQASQEAVGASRQTIIDLMARPQVLTQTIAVPVLDKANFETVLTKLVKETPTFSVARHAVHAETLIRTLEATNATVVGADAARAGGQLLIALAQQSNKPLGVATAALLSPQTRDRIFEAIAARSWEAAVDNITKKAAALALDQNILQDIVRRGNETFGVSTGKGGAVAARGFAEALWGNIAGPMENYIVSQHDLSKLGMPLLQRQFTSIELFMVASYAYVQGPQVVTMRGEGQKEGGGFLRFFLSFGAQEGAGLVVRRGLSAAASRTAGTGLGRFVGWLAGIFGARAGGVAAGAAAGSVAPGIGTIIGAVVGFVGGSLVMPAINWVGKLLKGEVGPLGAWTTGIQSYFRNVGYGTDAANQQKRTDLVIGIFIAVAILPVLPLVGALLTPTQQITTQNAALLTSYERTGGAIQEEYVPGNYFDATTLSGLGVFDCFSPISTGITTGDGQSQPLTPPQADKVRAAMEAHPTLALYSCVLGCSTNKINVSAYSSPNVNRKVYGSVYRDQPGNIVWWSNAFENSADALGQNMAHELAHILNQRRPEIFDAYYYGTTANQGAYCGPLGTYPTGGGLSETPDETFAESARLYIANNGILRAKCPQSVAFFDSLFLQCK